MRPRDLLYIGALLGVGFWIVDTWIHYVFFGAETLTEGYIPGSPVALYMRTLVCLLLFLLGIVAKGTMERIHRSRERLRKILDSATIGIHEMGFDGSIVTANPAAEAMLGLNRTSPGTSASYMEAVDPRDRDHVADILQDAKGGSVQRFNFRSTSGDRTRTLSASLAPLLSPDGEAHSVVALTEDVTGSTEARESLKRYERIVSASRDLIAFVGRDGTFLAANQALASHMGVDRSALHGKRIDEIGWRMGMGDDVQTYLERCLTGEEVSRQQWIRGEHGERFVDIKMTPFREETQITGAVISARDITEIKLAHDEQQKLEAQMLQAQKLESLGVMAGGIAHDFNNLLTGVMGQASLLHNELQEEAQRERVQAIQKSAGRAAELCKQMLAYAGEEEPDVQPASLNEILSGMADLLEVSISKKAILHRGFVDDLPEAEMDARQVRQVVMNLVTNASEALCDEPGDIRVSTGVELCDRGYLLDSYWCTEPEPGKYVYLEVSDTGCGMDEETLRTLLDPFFTTKFAGRGVGMAAVLGIVKGHRATLRIDSEVGVGTTVRVLFPALPGPELEAAASSVDVWQADGTILVVDDEMAVQEVARDTLQLAGLSVLCARDGQEALRVYREHEEEIIAVILDQSMPVMSGDETFRALRNINPEVRVVLSSGFAQQDVAEALLDEGLAGFVPKPYGPGDLLAKLREILD